MMLARSGTPALCLAVLLWACDQPPATEATPPPTAVELSVSRIALGTLVTIVVRDPDREHGRAAIERGFAEIDRLESLISEWRETSEISALNRSAGEGFVQISPETVAILDAARAVAAESDGAFDPTVLPLVRLWGFEGGEPRVPDADAIDAVRMRVGWQTIEVDAAASRARLARSGAAVGLGAIGKGFIADRLLEALRRDAVPAAMVKASGDLAFYGGTASRPWLIAIEDPAQPGEPMAELELLEGGISTTAPTGRRFDAGGEAYHHILDPMTGWPARGARSVTVVAATATRSDALSTAVFVMGKGGPEFVRSKPDLGGVILFEDGSRWASPGLQVRWTAASEH